MQKKYILGLDLGETSVGWAIVGVDDDNNPRSLIDAGARIFPPGSEIDDKTGGVTSRSIERRAHRSARRVKSRRRRRKQKLQNIFIRNGMWDDSGKIAQSDPYELRARALDEELQPSKFGRALYQIAQRRGFKSNRKSGQAKEDGKVKSSIGELRRKMASCEARTLGEYLHLQTLPDPDFPVDKLAFGMERLRNQYTGRDMYEEEFELIWKKQAEIKPDLYSPELKESVHEAIFFQRTYELTEERRATLPSRANAHRAPQLGECPLIPGEKRCSIGKWVAQRFRLLKEVNNLKVADENHRFDPLTPDQREIILHELSRKKELTFDQMRKLFGWGEDYVFNLEQGKRKKLKGNAIEYVLIKAFKEKQWNALDEDIKTEIRHALVEEEDEDIFRAKAKKWGLDEKSLEDLLAFEPPEGHLSYSEKALDIIVPYMEMGMPEFGSPNGDQIGAVDQALQDGKLIRKESDEEQEYLPMPDQEEIRNPIVQRTLSETRKVVNALIREYGKPARIHVELAREMKNPGKRREEMTKKNRENEARNDDARKWFEDHDFYNPKRNDLIKYKLWKEQEYKCAYTGKSITQEMLLSSHDQVEIDHILPISRTLDDSYMNKVLCLTSANRDKGNNTPYEWKGGPDNHEFDAMMVHLKNMPKMPYPKKNRFSRKEIDTGKCIERQLNDTKYVSKLAAKFLTLLYPPDMRVGQKAVFTVVGQVTAKLRHEWGLNKVLSADGKKNRADHRHHAIDAAVVACTNRKHLQALARSMRREGERVGPPLPDPWARFREDVQYVLKEREKIWDIDGQEIKTHGVLISHRVNRKILGGFHEETNYGPTNEKGKFVYRMPVERLTGASVEKIRDPKIRDIVRNHFIENGFDPERNRLKTPPKAVFNNGYPLLPISEKKRRKEPHLPEGVPIKKVRLLKTLSNPFEIKGEDGKTQRAAILGNNHHVEIVEFTKENGKKELRASVVPVLEAAKRARTDGKSMVRRDHGDSARFIMSLSRGESILLKNNDSYSFCYMQKLSGVYEFSSQMDLLFRSHNDARPASEGNKEPFARVQSVRAWAKHHPIKISISPVGKLTKAND